MTPTEARELLPKLKQLALDLAAAWDNARQVTDSLDANEEIHALLANLVLQLAEQANQVQRARNNLLRLAQ